MGDVARSVTVLRIMVRQMHAWEPPQDPDAVEVKVNGWAAAAAGVVALLEPSSRNGDATPTWPENVKPTPEQFADYLADIPRQKRIEIATNLLDAMDRADSCFLHDHEGMEAQVRRSAHAVARYRAAWLSARRRIHPENVLRALRGADQ